MTYQAGDPLTVRWGNNVRTLRMRRGLTQKLLGELIGVDACNISRIENGKQRPTDENRIAIADALGVTVAKIFDYKASAK